MSATAGSGPVRSFQSRLNRVAEARAPIDAAKPEISVLPDWKRPFVAPLCAFGALCVGFLAVMAARAIRAQFLGGTFSGENPDVAMMMDGGLALLVGTLLCLLVRFRGVVSMTGQVVGIALAILFAHNAAHVSPSLHSAVFSPQWTSEIVSASDAQSLHLRGEFVQLVSPVEEVAAEVADETAGDAEAVEEEVALPRVIRLQ